MCWLEPPGRGWRSKSRRSVDGPLWRFRRHRVYLVVVFGGPTGVAALCAQEFAAGDLAEHQRRSTLPAGLLRPIPAMPTGPLSMASSAEQTFARSLGRVRPTVEPAWHGNKRREPPPGGVTGTTITIVVPGGLHLTTGRALRPRPTGGDRDPTPRRSPLCGPTSTPSTRTSSSTGRHVVLVPFAERVTSSTRIWVRIRPRPGGRGHRRQQRKGVRRHVPRRFECGVLHRLGCPACYCLEPVRERAQLEPAVTRPGSTPRGRTARRRRLAAAAILGKQLGGLPRFGVG